MAFNLNISRKPEYKLQENLIDENINMYGFPVMFLYSSRINEDSLVFKDFSHLKVEPGVAQQIYLLPEDAESWGGETTFNAFGFYDMNNTTAFISKRTLLTLFPDYVIGDSDTKIINSLIITPDSTILEITDIDRYGGGINNLWTYADDASSFKLTMKIYDVNISDEGVSEIKETIKLEETGGTPETEIFSHEEDLDTTSIDSFFEDISKIKVDVDEEAKKKSSNNNPFGDLS